MSKQLDLFPSIDNVLEKYKIKGSFQCAYEASKEDQDKGFMVKMPGLSPCPWCEAEMVEIDTSFKVVCVNNPLHKAIWVPWGG